MSHAKRRRRLIPAYFFIGGLAGGLYVLAALEQLTQNAPTNGWFMAWLGFRLSLPLVVVAAAILLIDLTRPGRFWRLLTQLKWSSMVSVGTWTLVAFGAVSLLALPWVLEHLSFLTTSKTFSLWDPLSPLSGPPVLCQGGVREFLAQDFPHPAVHSVGFPAALSLCAYTGILLTASGRSGWNCTPWLGSLFFLLAIQSAIAVGLIVGVWIRPASAFGFETPVAPGPELAWQSIWFFPLLMAATGALILVFVTMHLRRMPRLPHQAGGRLVSGPLGIWFRVGLVTTGLLPQLFWAGSAVPVVLYPWFGLAALAGNVALRTVLFCCEEE